QLTPTSLHKKFTITSIIDKFTLLDIKDASLQQVSQEIKEFNAVALEEEESILEPILLTTAQFGSLITTDLEFALELPEYPTTHKNGYTYCVNTTKVTDIKHALALIQDLRESINSSDLDPIQRDTNALFRSLQRRFQQGIACVSQHATCQLELRSTKQTRSCRRKTCCLDHVPNITIGSFLRSPLLEQYYYQNNARTLSNLHISFNNLDRISSIIRLHPRHI
ncbi:hypothetical protein BU23DRAFT_604602, partial [Bimuria novae-zelandiae CBS 107.79]